jgi:hypothetical protein
MLTTRKEEGLPWATGSKETPPEWMKSKQKAEHKRSTPKTEWFRNRQDKLRIEPAKKADKARETDTVCNGQVKGSKWWGSLALLKTPETKWTIRAEIMTNTKRLEMGLGKPRSSKSRTDELVHKIDLERPVETPRNHLTPMKIPAAELDQLGSIKFTTGQQKHCNEEQTTLPHKEEARGPKSIHQEKH